MYFLSCGRGVDRSRNSSGRGTINQARLVATIKSLLAWQQGERVPSKTSRNQ